MILGIDTATRTVAIGIAVGARPIADAHLEGTGLRTRALLGGIEDLLHDAGARADDLKGVAVGVGPGSFTGLRVGIAAAQGIALGLGVPVVGVGTLECVARNAPPDADRISVLVDAGRGEVFLGVFASRADAIVALAPVEVLSPGRAAEAIPPGTTVLGDGWLRYRGAFERLLGAGIRTLDENLSRPRGAVVAALGMLALSSAARGGQGTVEPVYIRAPDAKLYEPPPDVRPTVARTLGG
ncbi:MAG: tRNA (adenosine(37)-N6)-threonylcarbamoyltransferase complex dimerization subunit type 1 TsaB [Deltaproteobacteria bacterium]|jgi:tRNA threonylcarbamoyladenosine biosynthesis protein TsaB|nr:tRNA (adenosine(37)-N6)-threonylcarbamoyltransferase complex dimerization subunit type 1 TsaB [Deltaproteobacteria bacterium]